MFSSKRRAANKPQTSWTDADKDFTLKGFIMRNVILIFSLLLLFCSGSQAQIGLGGFNAVMTVPSAQLQRDGDIALGIGYVPKPYGYAGEGYNTLAYFANVGFLPFMEIGLRATRALHYVLPSIGDRMVMVRLRLQKEAPRRPALVIGMHDPFRAAEPGSAGHFNALYAVATKTVFSRRHFNLDATVGYGVDWFKKAQFHQFNGLFGGMSVGYRKAFFIKSEYDAIRFNIGCGVELGKFLAANFVLIDARKAAFGVNLKKSLL
jgi:hypothetical protein